MRKPVTLSIACIICLIALLATKPMAFAQAGSTGGTIGKTDKSLSGGEEQRQPVKRNSGDRNATAAPATISGKWSWQAKCEGGSTSTGDFNFDQNTDGTFSGSCHSISGAVPCSVFLGGSPAIKRRLLCDGGMFLAAMKTLMNLRLLVVAKAWKALNTRCMAEFVRIKSNDFPVALNNEHAVSTRHDLRRRSSRS
jgi:hypothetical protein